MSASNLLNTSDTPGIRSILSMGTCSKVPTPNPLRAAVFLSSSLAPKALALSLASPAPANAVVNVPAATPDNPAATADAPKAPAPYIVPRVTPIAPATEPMPVPNL